MKKLLLDTNSLVLWAAGHCDRGKIGNHRRLDNFFPEQFDWLDSVVSEYANHTTLPNILSEASNLIIDKSGPIFKDGEKFLAAFVAKTAEHYVPTVQTLEGGLFSRHGSTDIAILIYAASHNLAVVTGDHALYGMLCERSVECFNIWHVLTPKR